jgi:hypothetical protein
MSGRARIRCARCKKRIPNHEPDLVLHRLDGEQRRYYHARCAPAALELVTDAPDVWVMSVRHVEEMAN